MSTPSAAEHRSGATGEGPGTGSPPSTGDGPGTAPPAAEAPGTGSDGQQAPRKQRPARVVFGSTVLWCEMFVVFFALLVAYGLRVTDPTTLGILGGIGMVACAVAARLQRTRAGVVLGSGVQVLLLLGGLLVPMMFVVGGVFTVIWVLGVWLGSKIDRERAERDTGASTLGA